MCLSKRFVKKLQRRKIGERETITCSFSLSAVFSGNLLHHSAELSGRFPVCRAKLLIDFPIHVIILVAL